MHTKNEGATLPISGPHNQDVVVLTHAVEGKAPESKGKMVLHRYGESSFLRGVSFCRQVGLQCFPVSGRRGTMRQRSRDADRSIENSPIANW